MIVNVHIGVYAIGASLIRIGIVLVDIWGEPSTDSEYRVCNTDRTGPAYTNP